VTRKNAYFVNRFAALLAVGFQLFTNGRADAAQTLTGEPRALKVVVLEGSPYHRGLVHGRTLRKEIVQLVQIWKTNLTETFNADADRFISAFLKQTDYVSAIYRDAVVYKKAGQSLVFRGAALAIKRAG